MPNAVQMHLTPTGRVSTAPTTAPKPPRKKNGRNRQAETSEQIKVIAWARAHALEHPCLVRLHHIPNGGIRSPRAAAVLQKAGVTPGIPDLFLPAPCGPYHGLYIEMKAAGGRVTPEQADFIAYATAAGYRAVVCYGAGAAITAIEDYLETGTL